VDTGRLMIILVDWFINRLFSNRHLRDAIFAEVHFYDQIDAALKEPTTNLTWEEGGLWYGYTYDSNARRYYFDDIGHESLIDLWEHRLESK
jgi:hypothetical protein